MTTLNITTTPAHAPFQERLEIDLSSFDFKDRMALSNALQLEALLFTNLSHYEVGAGRMPYESFIAMDATAVMVAKFRAVLDRFEQRHTLKAEPVELPKIPFRARLAAWLNPQHDAPIALKRFGSVQKVGSRYQFEVELNGTAADLNFIKIMRGVIASPSCPKSKMRVRGLTVIFQSKQPDIAHRVWLCARKTSFDKPGQSAAICPAFLWLASIIPAGDDD